MTLKTRNPVWILFKGVGLGIAKFIEIFARIWYELARFVVISFKIILLGFFTFIRKLFGIGL